MIDRSRYSLRVVIAMLMLIACRTNQPVILEPSETPPLPPSSGTVVGLLIDAAPELGLGDDQLTKMRDIDARLTTLERSIESRGRTLERGNRPPEEGGRAGRGGRGPGGGGMGGGGMGGPGGGGMGGGGMGGPGGGGMGGPGGGGMGAGGPGGGPRPGGPRGGGPPPNSKDEQARSQAERTEGVAAALRDVFALLTPEQRADAEKILDDHEVTVPADLRRRPAE